MNKKSVIIPNPIYDVSFRYLMADNESAKTHHLYPFRKKYYTVNSQESFPSIYKTSNGKRQRSRSKNDALRF